MADSSLKRKLEGAPARSMSLVALPKDVLRIIVKKLSLEDRLRLELIDKSHRDMLRDRELWQELNLGAMQALSVTEDQLLHLLGRIDAGFEQIQPEIESMRGTLKDIAEKSLKQFRGPLVHSLDSYRLDVSYFGADMVDAGARYFSRLHQLVPEAWGPLRKIVETCTTWFAERVDRLFGILFWFYWLLLAGLKLLLHPSETLKRFASQLLQEPKFVQRSSAKIQVILDVSEAAKLSPPFLAACIIAISAAGYRVKFKMAGESDPPFPLNHMLDILCFLASDSLIQVNMLVSGHFIWKTHFLREFNPKSLEGVAIDVPGFDPQNLLVEISYAKSQFCDITASKAVYREFQKKVLELLQRRLEIANVAGRPSEFRKGCVKPRIVASTVVFENMAILSGSKLYDEIREYLHDSPSQLRLVFRNCLILPSEIRSLCTLLGDCGAGFISFQQLASPLGRVCNPQTEDAVLSSVALQKSINLQILELDCPLLLADLDSAARFLDRSESFAKLVIHLRTEFFSTSAETRQPFFAKLQELCASERGARVTVVQHRRPSRLGGARTSGAVESARAGKTVESARGAGSGAFSPIQEEISTVEWYEKLLKWADFVMLVYSAVDAVLALGFLFGIKLFGYRLQPTNVTTSFSGSFGVWHLWRPLRATIQGKRDWVRLLVRKENARKLADGSLKGKMEGAPAGSMLLAALPKDVLRIILKKLSLEDRLRLELIDKSHRDVLRDRELWEELNLGAMQALSVTEDQLLLLLGRIDAGFEQIQPEIESMRGTLKDMAKESSEYMRRPLVHTLESYRLDLSYFGADMLSAGARYFSQLHQIVPEAWGPLRAFVATCTVWFADQVSSLFGILSWFYWLLLACLTVLLHPYESLERLVAQLLRVPKFAQRSSAKIQVSLDVSGAANLSPPFLAACIIALSAAGYRVDFKMAGEGDPLFPLNHMLDILGFLASDCLILVSMLVAGQYLRKAHFLREFNPERLGEVPIAPEFDPLGLLVETFNSMSSYYEVTASKAVYRAFEERIYALVQRRLDIAKISGAPVDFRKGCVKPRIVASTVVFEDMALLGNTGSKLFEEIREFLKDSPSKLRLLFRNCLILPTEVRSLCTLLGECRAGFVSFQQLASPLGRLCNPQSEDAVLGSVALQKSGNLQILELDCPLVLADLDSAANFLDRSENSAKLLIHLRTEFFSTDADARQLFFAKLQELCASERGARVTVVQHRRPSRLGSARARETVESAREGSSDAFAPIQEEISTLVWYEKLLSCADKIICVYTLLDAVLALALVFDFELFGYRLQPIGLAIGLSGSGGIYHLWRPVRAVIQGKRDWVGIAGGLFLSGVLPVSPLVTAFKGFWIYIAICLVRTVLWQTGKAILSLVSS